MSGYFELAKSFNKQGAYRVQRNARFLKDIKQFVKDNPDENLYQSVYEFLVLSEDKCAYPSAIMDKIFCEFDSPNHGVIDEETWRDLRKFIDWCVSESKFGAEIHPQIWFSGGSGYHVIFSLPTCVQEYNNTKVIQRINYKLKDLSGSKLLDLQANHGFTQLRRIPNTKHQRTGFYCIPLTVAEAYELPPAKVMELAAKPRKINNYVADSTYFVDVIKFVTKALKDERANYFKRNDEYAATSRFVDENGLPKMRPCIFRLTSKANPNFSESTWLACELIRVGWSDDNIANLFKELRPLKYDYATTIRHLGLLRNKGIKAPSCSFLREKNYCNDEMHVSKVMRNESPKLD